MSPMRASAIGTLSGLPLLALVLLGCTERPPLRACDIALDSCQQDVFYALASWRGDGYDAFGGVPPIRNVKVDDYRKQLEEAAAHRAATQAPEQGARERARDRGLTLLGLLEPTTSSTSATIEERVDNVVAYYGGGEVVVIDRGGKGDAVGGTLTLVHELSHAFQDRDGLLIGGATTDLSFARRAATEGEAELHEQLAVAELVGVAIDEIDYPGYYSNWLGRIRDRVQTKGAPFGIVSSSLIYPLGATFMIDVWRAGGSTGVRQLFDRRPVTSLELMRGQLRKTPFEEPIRCSVEAPEPGDGRAFDRFVHDRFGAAQVYAYLSRRLGDDGLAWQWALSWVDDHYWLYGEVERGEEVALVWRIMFEDEVAAEKVYAAHPKEPPEGAEQDVELHGSELLLRISDVQGLLEAWDGGRDCE
ncbi:MAG: hypothetical protein OEZ06_03075 [Myxococcales bacterium]|nr:hypothetical protein [Myxococcales bacterium]